MLKDINRRRPDRQLERNLVFLAYAIMLMSLSLFALFLYPQYTFYIIISIVVWNILCILITIRILKVSENAIGFGALAAAGAASVLRGAGAAVRPGPARGRRDPRVRVLGQQ